MRTTDLPSSPRRAFVSGAATWVATLGATLPFLTSLGGCASRSAPGPGTSRPLSSEPTPEPASVPTPARLSPAAAAEVAFLALSLVDTPYTWGGNTPQGGFDCSGLIVYAFRTAAGVELPRTVAQLARVGVQVPETAARTGDLVFFHTNGPYSHAGIFVGEGRFVHAPSTGGLVRLDGIGLRYWRTRMAGIRRV
jgi:cell wall-associated NlpC family hydrolase